MELAEMNSVAVVLHTGGNGHRSLVAYFVAGKEYTPGDLKLLLKDLLPHYMIPSRFVRLERMLLTVNGKIDRDRLPSPEQEDITGSDGPALVNKEVEDKVREIWKGALEKETIGGEEDFFFIGGDSINAVDMLGKIRKAFNREITVSNLYQYSTLSAFSSYIEASSGPLAGEDAWTRLTAEMDELKRNILRTHPEADRITDIYPMTDIQKGMMIISLTNPGSAVYHDQFVYQVEYAAFDIDLFRKAFSLLVDKHETLRTGLSLSEDNDGEQVIFSDVPVDIAYEDLSLYSAGDQEEMISAYLQNELASPFDLAMPPLWRVKIVKLGRQKIAYLLQFHHAILDGWSVAALNTELNGLYIRLKEDPHYLPRRLKCTNKEAVMDQLLECRNEDNIEFWRNELQGYRRMDLFTDMPVVRNFRRSYPDPYPSAIGVVIGDNSISPKSLYFACCLYALHSISGQRDMTIGIVGNNRPLKEDGHSLLGCFLNTVPVRLLFPPAAFCWREYVQCVEDKLNEVARHDRITLLRINEAVGDPAKRQNPFFDILFNYINFHIYDALEGDPSGPGRIKSLADRLTIDNHELTNSYLVINVDTTYKQLSVSYVLRRGMRPDISLEQLHDYFDIALNGYLNSPDTPISESLTTTDDSLQEPVVVADTTPWWNVDEAF
jgi:surfactin family lipopeptide synthetase A